eukprot:910207-Karenia_brevis.AAC.1
MAFLKKLESKVAAVSKKQEKLSDKKTQICKFFWQGNCHAYRQGNDCNFLHCLPDDKSRKPVAHPYP